MAQTVSLALGTAVADSSDITVAAGVTAIIGIYADTGVSLRSAGDNFKAEVFLKTPGEPHWVGTLSASSPSLTVNAPGAYFARRGSALVPIGVFSES